MTDDHEVTVRKVGRYWQWTCTCGRIGSRKVKQEPARTLGGDHLCYQHRPDWIKWPSADGGFLMVCSCGHVSPTPNNHLREVRSAVIVEDAP